MTKEIKWTGKSLEKAFAFLDDLRESGVTNMYGASPYLEGRFPGWGKSKCIRALTLWMKTFTAESVEARAKKALELPNG